MTIVFTDIVGSTALRDRLVAGYGELRGDQRYRSEILDLHNGRIRPILQDHRGFEVKTNGDSFMAAFQSARDAVECAAEIQRSFRDNPVSTETGRLRVRIGMHTGHPVPFRNENGGWDYDGHAVNIAARIESLIEGGDQILCSSATCVAADIDTVRYHNCGYYLLRGVHESVEVFDVLWRDEQQPKPPERRVGQLEAALYEWLTPWIGRRAEMAELASAIRHDKLVTVHGTGGVGKTRLTVEMALDRRGELPRQIVLVPMESRLDTRDDFIAAVRDALHLDEDEVPDFAALRTYLSGGDRLLILDNFETVMSASGLVPLLAVIPGVRIVVTTQTLLNVTGEKVVRLEPMRTTGPTEDLESCRLFVELARRRAPGWSPADPQAMQEIIALTDGLPYLIEMVAPFASERPLGEIAHDLKQSVTKTRTRRSDELRADRHHSVDLCLGWVIGRLQQSDRRALSRLSIFAGSFDVEAAHEVCGTSPDALGRLLDGSLLRLDRSSGRYGMLSITRAFLRDQLGGLRDGLAIDMGCYYEDRIRRADAALQAPGAETQQAARQWIAAESDNIRNVLAWAVDTDFSILFSIVTNLSNYFIQRSHYAEMLRQNLVLEERVDPRVSTNDWAVVQLNIAMALGSLPTGDRSKNIRAAISRFEAVLPVIERDQPMLWANAQNSLGNAYLRLPVGNRIENLSTAISCYDAALRIWTEEETPWKWGMAHHNIGRAYAEMPTGERLQNTARAIHHYTTALRGWTEQNYPLLWAMTWINIGEIYRLRQSGEPSEDLKNAVHSYEAALRVYTEPEFPENWAMAHHNIALAYAGVPMQAHLNEAMQHYAMALRVWTETENPGRWALTQNNLGAAYYLTAITWSPDIETLNANCNRAIECFEAALRVRSEHDFPADWAMTHCNLGNAFGALRSGDQRKNVERAIEHYNASLRVYTESRFPPEWARVQLNLGTLLASQLGGEQNLRDAIRCFESAQRVWNERDFAMQAALLHQRLAEAYGSMRQNVPNAQKEIAEYEEAARIYRAAGFGMQATNAQLAARLLKARASRSLPARLFTWFIRHWIDSRLLRSLARPGFTRGVKLPT